MMLSSHDAGLEDRMREVLLFKRLLTQVVWLQNRDFHALLPELLRPNGVYSYFNGLAADNAFFHSVYCRLVQMELADLNISTQFVPLPISVSDPKIWEGVKNRYFQLDTYLLPVCIAEFDV
jgi:protein arginine N-methyltransferase 2